IPARSRGTGFAHASARSISVTAWARRTQSSLRKLRNLCARAFAHPTRGERSRRDLLWTDAFSGIGPRGARAHPMTSDRRGPIAPHGSNDVPRFAPNFSVYLLPPDAVCLFSEDRKFFLHGELYCALASAIGNGGRSFRDLFGELERKYPSDKIQEAFTRLLDRRYLVQTSSSSKGTASAYWASLGLPLE